MVGQYCEASHMIFEVTFWIAFILASRAIAKIYYRRRDVLYGPYRATTRCRRSKADEWSRQNFNQWDSATGGGDRAFASPRQTRHHARSSPKARVRLKQSSQLQQCPQTSAALM